MPGSPGASERVPTAGREAGASGLAERTRRGAQHLDVMHFAKDAPNIDLPRMMTGRYRLDSFMGEGGFGRVYQGFDTWLERPVAVKVPKVDRPVTVRGGPVPHRGPQGGPAEAPEHRGGP